MSDSTRDDQPRPSNQAVRASLSRGNRDPLEHDTLGDDFLRHVTRRLSDGGFEAADAEARRIVEAARRLGGARAPEVADSLVARRLTGEPIGYVVGREPFLGLELLTDADVLIPRQETELLARTAIDILQENPAGRGTRIIDMCCGAGNLACSIAAHIPGAEIWAADLTESSVSLTRRNAAFHNLSRRVNVVQSDLFSALLGLGLEQSIDVIVCNPPYISTRKLDTTLRELVAHEPREAFDGGPFGLAIQMGVIREAVPFLRPGGALLFEIGHGQDRQITKLFRRVGAYEEPRLVADERGDARVAVGLRRRA